MGILIWKNPLVYWNTRDVKKHYSLTIENFFNDLNKIDIRRMHVIYEDYFSSDLVNIEQIKKTFQGLLFEKLIGINSRIIILKKFDQIKDHFYFDPIDIQIKESPKLFV